MPVSVVDEVKSPRRRIPEAHLAPTTSLRFLPSLSHFTTSREQLHCNTSYPTLLTRRLPCSLSPFFQPPRRSLKPP